MTISLSDGDVAQAIELAIIVGGLVALLIVGLLVYLVVRPSRRRVKARPEADALDVEEMLALIDRMERRLAVLERAVADEAKDGKQLLEAGEGPEIGRMK